MRAGVAGYGLPIRNGASHRRALVVRGGLPRTFGGLTFFFALTLLCWGVYLLEDALAHPVTAQAAALISAAFIIALAIILLFYLLKPRRKKRGAHLEPCRHPSLATKQALTILVPPRGTEEPNGRRALPRRSLCADLSYSATKPVFLSRRAGSLESIVPPERRGDASGVPRR